MQDRPSPSRSGLVDVALACLVFAVMATQIEAGGVGQLRAVAAEPDLFGWALAAGASLPLAVRRRWSLPVLVLLCGGSVALAGRGYGVFLHAGVAASLHTIALHPQDRRRRDAAAIALAALAGLAIAERVRLGTSEDTVTNAVIWAVAWLLGERRREAARRKADRQVELERSRQLSVALERERIARELHDSAGHAMNVVLVQAGAGRLALLDGRLDACAASLAVVEEVSRDILGEIDQLVLALRDDDAQLGPGPGLAQLDRLLGSHRASGRTVWHHQTGRPRPLPPQVDRAAYRIIQEALTNAARHGAGDAELRLEHTPDGLAIDVRNPVAVPTAVRPDEGHGLIGMRERVALLGGTIDVVQDRETFHVRVDLPAPKAHP